MILKNGPYNGRDLEAALEAEQRRDKRCVALCSALLGHRYNMSFTGEVRRNGASKPSFTMTLRGMPKDQVRLAKCALYQGSYEREIAVQKASGGFFKLKNLMKVIEKCAASTYDLRDIRVTFDIRRGYQGQ